VESVPNANDINLFSVIKLFLHMSLHSKLVQYQQYNYGLLHKATLNSNVSNVINKNKNNNVRLNIICTNHRNEDGLNGRRCWIILVVCKAAFKQLS